MAGLIPFELPQGPNVNLLMQPLQQGLQSYRQGMDKQFQGERELKKEQLAERADTRQQQAFDLEQQKAKVQQIAGLAQMADNEKDPARRQQIWGRIVSSHPEMASALDKYGANDHINGPKFLIAEARGFVDPTAEELKRAQINLTNKQAANVGADAYDIKDGVVFNKRSGTVTPLPEGAGNVKTSLQPIWGQDENGNLVPMQPNSRGEAVKTKLPEGITPTKGVQKVDAGTHFILFNQMTGQTIGVIPKDVAGKEREEEIGKASGKAQVDLPRIESNSQRALETLDAIRKHPGKQYGVGVAGVLPGIPGTAQRGFVNLVNQAKGQTFLEAFNSLRGGGAITEKEGEKATEALARLDRAQSQADFDKALDDLEIIVRRGMATAQSNAKLKSAPERATPSGNVQNAAPAQKGAIPKGDYVFDPATGTLRPK